MYLIRDTTEPTGNLPDHEEENEQENAFDNLRNDREQHMFGDDEEDETQINHERGGGGNQDELERLHQLGAVGGGNNPAGLETRAEANGRKEKHTQYNIQNGRQTKVHRKFDRQYHEYVWEDFNNIAKEMLRTYDEVKKSFTDYYAVIRSADERDRAQTDFT